MPSVDVRASSVYAARSRPAMAEAPNAELVQVFTYSFKRTKLLPGLLPALLQFLDTDGTDTTAATY